MFRRLYLSVAPFSSQLYQLNFISSRALRCSVLSRKSCHIENLLALNIRAMSSVTPDMNLNYEDIVQLTNNQSIILIDVREPKELQESGVLPGSINIPLNDVKAALLLSGEEFQKKYGISLPDKDSSLVFSCRSGNRSTKALIAALDLGFQRSKHYAGGYLDWEKHIGTGK